MIDTMNVASSGKRSSLDGYFRVNERDKNMKMKTILKNIIIFVIAKVMGAFVLRSPPVDEAETYGD